MDTLTRSYAFDARADNEGDGLTLEGYAAVFNSPTDIADWDGNYRETILPGAFTRSLSKRTPVLQFDHGKHPLVGSIPLGSIQELREDDHGLFVRARLHANWLVEPVRDAIRSGAVDGMSFRFAVRKDDWSSDRSERTIREVELFELGPVVFPAYEATTVGVRSRELADLLADPEVRADLARVLIAGTSEPDGDAVGASSGDEDADTRASHVEAHASDHASDDDPDHDSGLPNLTIARNRVLRLTGVLQ